MKHCDHDCKHKNVKYCEKCGKVYCEDCSREWPESQPYYVYPWAYQTQWPWTAYPNNDPYAYTSDGTGQLLGGVPTSGDTYTMTIQ